LNITKFLKKNVILIFSFPVLANSFLNLFLNMDQIIFQRIYFVKFISFLLGTIFFFYVSNTINNALKVGGRAISLVIFFTSYFTIDSIFLFISKNLTFGSLIIYISAIWIILLIYRSKSIINILKIFFWYFKKISWMALLGFTGGFITFILIRDFVM